MHTPQPGHTPTSNPYEPTGEGGSGRLGCYFVRSVCARPLTGGQAAPPPCGGLGRCPIRCAPDPLWGAGLPHPHVGGWGVVCLISLRARPLAFFSSPRRLSPEADWGSRGGGGSSRHAGGAVSGYVSQISMFQGVSAAGGCRRPPTARADASRLRTLRSMPAYWFFWQWGARAWRGMGQRSPSAWRRHGAQDGNPGGCSRSCAACACPLPRAWSVSLSSPILWQHGVVRHVERLPGQGARAGCAQDGHSRSRTRVAASSTRSGPPASTASEASRGPFCVCEVEERERVLIQPI